MQEITETKRKIIILLNSGQKSRYEIIEHLGVSKQRVGKLLTEMGDMLLHHEVKNETMWLVSRKNVKTKHSSDMYVLDILLILAVTISALLLTVFLPIWFVFGAIFSSFFMFFRVFWKITRHPDYVKYYHKPTATKG